MELVNASVNGSLRPGEARFNFSAARIVARAFNYFAVISKPASRTFKTDDPMSRRASPTAIEDIMQHARS